MLYSFAANITSNAGGGNWNNAATWAGGVIPGAGDNVTITGNVTVNNAAAAATNVTINAGGTLTCSNAGLTVGGNWTNNGTFNGCPTGQNGNAAVEKVTFTGPNSTIGGSSVSRFCGLTINPGAGGTVAMTSTAIDFGPEQFSNATLTLQSGTFDVGAGHAINSKSQQGGTIVSMGGNFKSYGPTGWTLNMYTAYGSTFNITGNVTLDNVIGMGTGGNFGYSLQNNTANGLRVNGMYTVKGDQSQSWGIKNNPPIWGPASTLYRDFNNQGFDLGQNGDLSWAAQSGTIGVTPGYPNNVTFTYMGSSKGTSSVTNEGMGWMPNTAIGLNGALRIGDGTTVGRVSFENVTDFKTGGLIIDNTSVFVSPKAGAVFNNKGDFILQGATTGVFNSGATINFNGSGTSGTPQTISTTGLAVTFTNMTVSNGTYVKLQDKVNVTGTLNLTSGLIGTTTTNVLTIANTATTAINGGSATAYIDGPLAWTIPAGTGTYSYPVGNGGAYLPLTLNPNNSASGATATATAFNQNSNGSPDATVTSISPTEYWSVATSTPFASGPLVGVTRNSAVAPNNALAVSTSAGGVYTAIGGTPSGNSMTGGGIGTASPAFITIVRAPLSVVKLSGTNTGCNGTTGSLEVGGSGGTPPYQFSKDNGATYQASGNFTNLLPGDYVIMIKDASLTTKTNTLKVLGSVVINDDNKDVSICSGTSTTLVAKNLQNTTPTFTWSNSPTFVPILAGTGAGGANLTVSPTVNTTYYVKSLLYSKNLVVNGGFEAGASGFTSSYTNHTGGQYSNTPGNNGYYKISNAGVNLCAFFSSLPPQSGGSYFIGDGAIASSKVWEQTINSLTIGEVYKVQYWYAAGNPDATRAQLRTTITSGGTANLGTVNTTDHNGWTQATYTWTATGTSATMVITNMASPGNTNGNDFYIDNIEFLAPCEVVSSINVIVSSATPGTVLAASQNVCAGVVPNDLTLTGNTNTTITRWERATNAGFTTGLTSLAFTTTTLTGANTGISALAAGTYYFRVVQNGCGTQLYSSTATIVVNSDATMTLTSASNSATTCINTAITPITYTIGGGATGAGATGLPSGVSGVLSGTTFTISGTPTTTTGSPFSYTVTTTGNCLQKNLSGTITVNPDATLTLTSASNSATTCVNTAITPITYTIGGGATGAGATGLPAGVSGVLAGNVFTISGTPTTTTGSPFNYTVTTTGTCGQKNLSGTITVNTNATLVLSSASNSATTCINTAITPITYTIGGGATGAGATGLPAGVAGVLAGNVFTISGTPTTTAGSPYTYTVTTTGNCTQTNLSGTITVNPDATLTLSSASNSATTCVNTAITPITYTIGGGATGAGATGLPAGVTGVLAGNVFTISGTPTTTTGSPFSYTVTTTGTCGQKNLSGTITVNPNATLTLSSANNTNAQSVCINKPITPITYTIGGGATGAGVTGLPAGVAGVLAGNVFTISGTPSTITGSPFAYKVTTTGTCTQTNLSGTITVTSPVTPSLSCGTSTISTVEFTWPAVAGATGYDITTKVNAGAVVTKPAQNSTQLSYTESGLTAGDDVEITVTPTGPGCFAAASLKCTAINCTPSTVVVPSDMTPCNGDAIAQTNFTSPTAGATFKWENDNTSIGLATASGTGNVPAFTANNSGSTPVTANIKVTPIDGLCTGISKTYKITVSPAGTNARTSAANTDAQAVCINQSITNITYEIGGSATSASLTGTLPAGVAGVFDLPSKTFTISGTPTASAATPFSYTVTATGPCAPVPLSGTLTVNPILTPAITCGTSSNTTVEFNWAAVTGATDYTLSSKKGAVVTSGGNTTNLTFSVNSLSPGDEIELTVTPNGTGCFKESTLTCKAVACSPIAAIVPDDIVICAGNVVPLQNFTSVPAGATFNWTVTGGAIGMTGPATGTGDVPSFTATNNTNADITATITVKPTIGPCTGPDSVYTITIHPSATNILTSAPGTDNSQSICVNQALVNITYALGGSASGAPIVSTLPLGISAAYNSTTKIYTISGTPTSDAGGPFNYTVTTSGPCPAVPQSGSIIVKPIETTTISCGTPTISSAEFTWTATPNVTGYNLSYVRGGVTTNAGTVPASTLTYTVSSLNPDEAVDLTVTPVGPGCYIPDNLICKSKPCDPITVAVSNVAPVCVGAIIPATSFVSTPAGATYTWQNSDPSIGLASNGTGNVPQFIAANSNTSLVTATITVTPSIGVCAGTPNTYTIKVKPVPTIVLTSLSSTDKQVVCVNQAIDNITYLVGGDATGATITGGSLPVGVTESFDPATSIFTISGLPTAATTPLAYTITTSGSCPGVDASGTVTVLDSFKVDLGPDQLICSGETVELKAESSVALSYLWNTGARGDKIKITPLKTRDYVVIASNGACEATDSVTVALKNIVTPPLYIPNSFTPNGDLLNDEFKAYGEGVIEFDGNIFNKWGELIYHWDTIDGGWNGKTPISNQIAFNEVFVYSIRVKNECQKKFEPVRSGVVTVIR